MASGQTAHYGLSQWEPEDSFLREEFNANFSKIDTEVFSKAEAVTGTYTGDGESKRIIELGFSPTAVLLLRNTGAGKDSSNYYGGLALRDHPVLLPTGATVLAITSSGFSVHVGGSASISNSNGSGSLFHYLAFR